ncbi:MAG: hypothetical protein ACYDDF_12435, partial [Thermoplasmatota archaeon]
MRSVVFSMGVVSLFAIFALGVLFVGTASASSLQNPVCVTYKTETERCTCITGDSGCPTGQLACTQLVYYSGTCVAEPCYGGCIDGAWVPQCAPLGENTFLVGVGESNCQVSGYVCVSPTWYGGHGIWGFSCRSYMSLNLLVTRPSRTGHEEVGTPGPRTAKKPGCTRSRGYNRRRSGNIGCS